MSKTLATFALCLAASSAGAECRFTINFDFGSAALRVADGVFLGELARRYPEAPMALSAHADDDGSDAANARLADARARAVGGRLHGAGRQGEIRVFTLSDAWDVVPTEASSALNRRVELFVADCDPRDHPEARPYNLPGLAFRANGRRVYLTSPRLPRN